MKMEIETNIIIMMKMEYKQENIINMIVERLKRKFSNQERGEK